MKYPIRVKIIARGHPAYSWRRQTPGQSGHWGECLFLFDLEERDYDWLVVIDDVSRKLAATPEKLSCADAHTILVTTEPPTITHYGKGFAAQFQHVLTSQDATALPHPGRIHSTTGNLWFHGKTYDELIGETKPEKTRLLSTVCSSKQQKHTVHHARYDFTQWLKSKIPEMDIYGHGVRHVEKKHQALDPYKFHIAIENHVAQHHWTEKFSDPVLSCCIPIYYGCPNLSDYFPDGSYVQIDLAEREAAVETIRMALSDPVAYGKHHDAMLEARHLILERHNMLAILSEHVTRLHTSCETTSGRMLYGRKQMRLRHPEDLVSNLAWRSKNTLSSLTNRKH